MHYENEKMVSSIIRIISEISYYVLNQKGMTYNTQDDYLLSFVGTNSSQLNYIVSYIIGAAPHKIYLEKYSDLKNYLQISTIHQVVTLLLNSKVAASDFQYDLENLKNKIIMSLINQISIMK